MQPQQPYYQPPSAPAPQNTGQYDFIVNNGGTPRGPSQKTIILVVIGGAVLVIALVWIILALVFGGGSGSNTAPLVVIAQEQNEMVRITKTSTQVSHFTTQDARNFSKNTQMTLASDQNQLIDFLRKNGTKVNNKQLAIKQSATTDSALDAASTSGTYDSTFTGILQTQLKAYQASLVQANKTATSSSEKAMLKSQFDNATLLLEQSGQRS